MRTFFSSRNTAQSTLIAASVTAFKEMRLLKDNAPARAIQRAAQELPLAKWSFKNGVLHFRSLNSKDTYTTTKGKCSCPAGAKGLLCKHRAAWYLLTNVANANNTSGVEHV